MIDIKFQIGDKWFVVDPQPDITAYEAAQLFKIVLVCSNAIVPNDQRVAAINQYGLLRHFKEVEQ